MPLDRRVITVTLDEVRQVALEEVGRELAVGDEPLTMVVMTLDGELGGSIILMFDDQTGGNWRRRCWAARPARNPSGANWKSRR